MSAPVLVTRRLRLRDWRRSDLAPVAALNSDPRVMAFLPKLLERSESDSLVKRLKDHFAQHGFGWWAVERIDDKRFVGFVGLTVHAADLRFSPCVDVGWRLAQEYWGNGYASEAAQAALAFGFEEKGLDEIVSYTVPANARSRRVMERLGMTRNPQDDFAHPGLPAGHPLQAHVLYRLERAVWLAVMG
jgi:ribosomal-protein-alanine N-acetyltransferase